MTCSKIDRHVQIMYALFSKHWHENCTWSVFYDHVILFSSLDMTTVHDLYCMTIVISFPSTDMTNVHDLYCMTIVILYASIDMTTVHDLYFTIMWYYFQALTRQLYMICIVWPLWYYLGNIWYIILFILLLKIKNC